MVNPLPPHYRCPKCGYTEFVPNIADGFDLPQKACTCGAELIKDGHDIPFDAFARLERYATNVEIRTSDEFEPVAAEIIKSFYAGKADLLPVQMTSEGQLYNMKRYVVMTGDKPKPALSEDGFWHVDAQEYWDWEDTETTFTIYTSAQINRIQQFYEKTEVRFLAPVTLATETMARRLYQRHTNRWAYIAQCLDEGERQDFDLILRLEGLCSSSGGWNLRTWNGDLISSNGEALFKEGRVQFREIPAFRENIWHDINRALARNGIRDNGLALEVMEMARKGKYQKNGVPEKIRHALLSLGLPDWYTDYLGKVMYLFPKGHCVSLLLIDMVYEWYCMNYPEEAQDA